MDNQIVEWVLKLRPRRHQLLQAECLSSAEFQGTKEPAPEVVGLFLDTFGREMGEKIKDRGERRN